MRSIHQHGTTFISIPRKSDDKDCGSVIHKSKSERTTENDALRSPYMPDNGKDFIVDRPPSPHASYRWCSGCNSWVKPGGFGKDEQSADGLDHYCRDCRKQQERKWSLVRAYKKHFG